MFVNRRPFNRIMNLLWRFMTIRCCEVIIGRGSSLNCPVDIDKGTAIGYRFCVKGFGAAHIGKYCALGDDVKIITSDHAIQFPCLNFVLQKNILGETYPSASGMFVEIGNDVWIGDSVIILAGVSIGNGAVIGAGSIVTRSVGAYEVYAGVPAKLLKLRIDKTLIEPMQRLAWWNWSAERMVENRKFFSRPVDASSIESVK
jgi:virginiamycin A acetyltransferase